MIQFLSIEQADNFKKQLLEIVNDRNIAFQNLMALPSHHRQVEYSNVAKKHSALTLEIARAIQEKTKGYPNSLAIALAWDFEQLILYNEYAPIQSDVTWLEELE